jgi:hypothetical protein
VTLSAPALAAIGVDAGDKAAAEAKDPLMERSTYALHDTLRGSFAAAGTERVRVRGFSTRETTVTFSHRLAGALRPISAEPSDEEVSK